MVAANKAVKVPMIATTVNAIGARSKITCERETIYTPAVTIVAAWIRAETGVGPAIASGSQTYKGICALLPVAPIKSRSATEEIPPAHNTLQVAGSRAMPLIISRALATASGFVKKLTEPVR